MPPKNKVSGGSSKPLPVKKPGPLFHLIGKNRVAFIHAARRLSGVLERDYGPEVSISKFEKILGEVKGRSDLAEVIYLPQQTMDLYKVYLEAKSSMIEEQNLLRSSLATPVVNVEQSFDVATFLGGKDGAAVSEQQGGEKILRPKSSVPTRTNES